MATPAPTLLQTLLRTGEALSIAALGGAVFTLIGFPAGLIAGSLLAVAVAGLLGRPVMVPRPLFQVISVLIGISLGAVITPEMIASFARFPVSIAVLLVATVCMTAAAATYLRLVHGWDWQSALFGASPGALAQVIVLAGEYRADMRAIAIVQVMRVVILTIAIPTGLALFGLVAEGGMLPGMDKPAGSATEIAILIAVSTATAIALVLIRFPGGLLFGAMLGSGVLHGFGFVQATLPWWLVAMAVIGIGAVTGSRFANSNPRALLLFLAPALGSFTVAIVVASAFALLLTLLLPVRVADVVVAFSPGAQDTMMVLALALHLDPLFVGALHLARYILVSMTVPFLAHWIGPPPGQVGEGGKGPPAS